MDLANAIVNLPKSNIWTKSVTPKGKDRGWAYSNVNFHFLRLFLLNWKLSYKDNACQPKTGDLIILRQYGCVSHIVKVMNDTLYDDRMYDQHEYNISRLVQLVWITDWNKLTANKDFFGCYMNFPPNGKVYSMEKIDGFEAFSTNLANVLNSGKYLPLLSEQICRCD